MVAVSPITIYRNQRNAAEKNSHLQDIKRNQLTAFQTKWGLVLAFTILHPSTLAIEDHKPDRLSLASLTNLSLFASWSLQFFDKNSISLLESLALA